VIVAQRQDGATLPPPDIARAKAWTALSLGSLSRALAAMAENRRPAFVNNMIRISEGRMTPAPGGQTVVRDGVIAGAVRVKRQANRQRQALVMEGIGGAGLVWEEVAS
jgi:uncharacterized protein GlcG (DUF336 family)